MKHLDQRVCRDIALTLAQRLQTLIKRKVCTACRGSGQQQSDGCCVASTVCPHCGGEVYEPLKRSEIEAAVDQLIEALA
jgi:hypothetical protein